MGDLKLKELAIETVNHFEFEERNGLQTELVADHECQPTIDE